MGAAGILGSSADMSAVRQAIETMDGNDTISGISNIDMPQGRITLASGVPVMTASVTGATTVYYTPCVGQLVPIFNGTNFVMTDTQGELSQLTTDATKSPAAVGATATYDLFVWNDNGIIRCTRGPAWTNSTTRSLALTRVRGILVNAAAITNGAPIYQGTYVGTISSNASSTIDFIFGTAASGGGAAVLNVWNYYNRHLVNTRVTDTVAPYTYTTATVRQAGGSAGNQITYTIGVAEDAPSFYYQQTVTTAALAGATAQISIGDDSTTVMELGGTFFAAQAAVAAVGTMDVMYTKGMTETIAGLHVAAALEKGDGANANTFNTGSVGELSGVLWM